MRPFYILLSYFFFGWILVKKFEYLTEQSVRWNMSHFSATNRSSVLFIYVYTKRYFSLSINFSLKGASFRETFANIRYYWLFMRDVQKVIAHIFGLNIWQPCRCNISVRAYFNTIWELNKPFVWLYWTGSTKYQVRKNVRDN